MGRADDVINVGGLKVAPDELEAEAISIDGMNDCICIASDDEFTGSDLKLLLVMKEKGTMYNGKLNRKAYAE